MRGKHRDNGWPKMTYQVSKAAENAFTIILARDNPEFLINCCCPGWVDTRIGAVTGQPPKTAGKILHYDSTFLFICKVSEVGVTEWMFGEVR